MDETTPAPTTTHDTTKQNVRVPPKRRGNKARRRNMPKNTAQRGRDIILTGTPRSGTTLCCTLLNTLHNVVALNEPLRNRFWEPPFHEDDQFQLAIQQFLDGQRRTLLKHGTARSHQSGGAIPENTFSTELNDQGLRRNITSLGIISIDKPLTPDFTLAVKVPTLFTARLKPLAKRYPVFALVRNPVATLASWSSIATPPEQHGALKSAAFHPDLAQALDNAADMIDRQIAYLHWFFYQYATLLPFEHVIRYEDLVASRGTALSVIVPAAATLDRPLANQNDNSAYSRDLMLAIGERLLKSDGAYWIWYTRDDVRTLLAEIQRSPLPPSSQPQPDMA